MPENEKKTLTNGKGQIDLSADIGLGQRIMQYVPNRKTFTGQVNVEVHCKDGEIRDVYLTTRNKIS